LEKLYENWSRAASLANEELPKFPKVYVSGVSRIFPSYVTDDGEQQVVLECGEDRGSFGLEQHHCAIHIIII